VPRRETTQQRYNRLALEGVRMCGPVPPTDADLDVVEDFRRQLRERKAGRVDVAERVRAVADPLITHGGYTPDMIYDAVFQALGVGMGKGGSGDDSSVLYPSPLGMVAVCPYCGATGGGGHGGFCPNGTA
jgi:hypothetical protein